MYSSDRFPVPGAQRNIHNSTTVMTASIHPLFRDQDLTPEQQIDFSRCFGKLEIHVLGQWRHPEHPVTGRKCLFVNEGHTVEILGLPEKDGRELLDMLCRHATSPEFLYLHRWWVGDLLMWDNVATQHIAEFNYALPQRRYLHRTTLEGVALA